MTTACRFSGGIKCKCIFNRLIGLSKRVEIPKLCVNWCGIYKITKKTLQINSKLSSKILITAMCYPCFMELKESQALVYITFWMDRETSQGFCNIIAS